MCYTDGWLTDSGRVHPQLTSLEIQRKQYYKSTFNVDPDNVSDFCSKIAQEYVKGLCWVLTYYYQVTW